MRAHLYWAGTPEFDLTRVVAIDGKDYVCLRSPSQMVALYRVTNRGLLKRLKRHPVDGIMGAIGKFDALLPKDSFWDEMDIDAVPMQEAA
jgi:hypothetical protein